MQSTSNVWCETIGRREGLSTMYAAQREVELDLTSARAGHFTSKCESQCLNHMVSYKGTEFGAFLIHCNTFTFISDGLGLST